MSTTYRWREAYWTNYNSCDAITNRNKYKCSNETRRWIYIDNVKESFLESINTYFRDIRGEIIYTKVMGILINTAGVHDLSNLLINGSTDNITINEDKIPSVTTVNFSEVENQWSWLINYHHLIEITL